jgi:hypothetical protein
MNVFENALCFEKNCPNPACKKSNFCKEHRPRFLCVVKDCSQPVCSRSKNFCGPHWRADFKQSEGTCTGKDDKKGRAKEKVPTEKSKKTNINVEVEIRRDPTTSRIYCVGENNTCQKFARGHGQGHTYCVKCGKKTKNIFQSTKSFLIHFKIG